MRPSVNNKRVTDLILKSVLRLGWVKIVCFVPGKIHSVCSLRSLFLIDIGTCISDLQTSENVHLSLGKRCFEARFCSLAALLSGVSNTMAF